MRYLIDEKPSLDELAHYGVLGMKWGVRKDRDYPGASKGTNREARKDAKEFARAKMFYGEGAGNRRKLINASVNAKAKRDPKYKAAFDHHLNNQNMSTHARKARKERKRKDTTGSIHRTARGVNRQLQGGFGAVSLGATVITTAWLYAAKNGYDVQAKRFIKSTIKNMKEDRAAAKRGRDFLRTVGL